MNWKTHQRIEETIAFVQWAITANSKGNDCTWAITKPNSQLIGGCTLRFTGCKTDFGYVFGKDHWGHGYATETLQALIQWAFSQPEIFRVWGTCHTANAASAHVMEKCGLQMEGVLRKWLVYPQLGEPASDCLCYSAIRKSDPHAFEGNRN